jgi:hypothetical protein
MSDTRGARTFEIIALLTLSLSATYAYSELFIDETPCKAGSETSEKCSEYVSTLNGEELHRLSTQLAAWYVRLARRLFDVPIVLVSLVDANRQWFKSKQGTRHQRDGFGRNRFSADGNDRRTDGHIQSPWI